VDPERLPRRLSWSSMRDTRLRNVALAAHR
jgi:hypothetical protein